VTRIILSWACAAPFGVVPALAGCESRKLTEADCLVVKERVERAWEHDALAAQRETDSSVTAPIVSDQRRSVGDDFVKECRQNVGRPVTEQELTCLGKVETIDDVHACAKR
jgi:hypothetical protein